jgi:hypothetical protein
LIEILTHFRRAAISAQLPRHRLRVADGIGDEKFSTEVRKKVLTKRW